MLGECRICICTPRDLFIVPIMVLDFADTGFPCTGQDCRKILSVKMSVYALVLGRLPWCWRFTILTLQLPRSPWDRSQGDDLQVTQTVNTI